MRNTFGRNLSVTLFGESHGIAIGAVLDGLPAGIRVDEAYIAQALTRRRPSGTESTARQEKDSFIIQSGVFNGFTTGTPVSIVIPNEDTRSMDYSETRYIARPSHADYTAYVKYNGNEDYRGGGHFSGRITAALVAAGAIVMLALKDKGISIASHVSRCAGVSDRPFNMDNIEEDISLIKNSSFPVLDNEASLKMKEKINGARLQGDSVGGIVETVVTGLGAGVGEPWFDTLEGVISHAMFSIPAVKGIEFGRGFELADMLGSQANDPFYTDGEKIYTKTNNNGGINGGISNSMPVVFRCAIKPTPTISREQETVDMREMKNTVIKATGRHDPCIAHRAAVVTEYVTAIAVADMLVCKNGTDWLK